MDKFVVKYCELPKNIRRPLWQFWHKLIIRFDKNASAVFLNYGYEKLTESNKLFLHSHDEVNRYCIQLYDHVVNKVDLKGKDVLEVGSGRGGGASYIARYFKPKSYVGMDIAKSVVDFCNKHHKVDGLRFVKGYAESPPFENQSFDAVVNVESARCYSSLKTFFDEVHRILRPDGHFLFADMIKREEVEEINTLLHESGFRLISKDNISQNVVKALDIDHSRRFELIKKSTPAFLHKSFLEFAGAKGTKRYEEFAGGSMQYWTYVLAKNGKA